MAAKDSVHDCSQPTLEDNLTEVVVQHDSPSPSSSRQAGDDEAVEVEPSSESSTQPNWTSEDDGQLAWVMEEEADDGSHIDTDTELGVVDIAEDAKSSSSSEAVKKDPTQDIVITMTMVDGDDRFGFSVMGGLDEGFQPRTDEVTEGSPADRAELEVGDEIVEVNGHSLSGFTHAEIISHIHQCIKSRTIQLRVKRSGTEDVGPGINEIEDAYVIAVEDQAKERLEKLSLLHKVQPVDIAKVKDVSNNNHKCQVHNSDSSLEDKDDGSGSVAQNGAAGLRHIPTSGIGDSENCSNASASLANLTNEGRAELTDSKPCVTENMETSVINGYMDNLGNPLATNPKYTNSNSSMDNMYEPVEVSADDSDVAESGPHREMAIDCPPNFTASKKVPPRYPMMQQHTSSGHSSPRSLPGTPSRKADSLSGIRTVPDVNLQQPPQMTPEEKMEHLERIKKYQEDLRKRKEEENRLAQEQDFLRTSLRGSKKLQALEESRQMQAGSPSGFVNPIYQEDEEALKADSAASRAATLPIRPSSAAKKPIGVENLFSSVQHIQSRLQSGDQKEVAFLMQLFQNKRFQQALHIHNKVVEVSLRMPTPTPITEDAQRMQREVLQTLPSQSADPRVEELRRLLQTPHVKGLLYAHDKTGARTAEPSKAITDEDEREYLYERASQYGEESIKIVRLQKTADPLGATVRNEGESVLIGRIVKGGAAEKSGLLHEGDEILEINGVDIRGKTVNEVCDLMASLTGTLTFLIVPSQEFPQASVQDQVEKHMKAHFDYDPEDDVYIPCRELGISFVKGDILHVINMEDVNWWQAYREGEDDQALAGLIPSKSFQEQREALKQTIVGDTKETEKQSRCHCNCRQKKKKKNKLYDANGEDAEAEEILTYEEVSLYYPQPNRKRPVILIGPPNVGRQELRQRLMESDMDRFAAAIPHTSRSQKDSESDKDYHFVARHVFMQDLGDDKFVEYGEYEKNLYGTSSEAIREVVNSGKICVLNLYPQSLRILKGSDLKPFVMFISPPNMEKLKRLRQRQGAKVTDDELKDIIEKAREMEENYGHYFDHIIVNVDLDRAYEELLQEINRLEVEPQWVPSQWVL